MNSWAITDKGITRAQNQDAYYCYCDPEKKLALNIVCDGMGGANAGNVASQLATQLFVDELNQSYSSLCTDIGDLLQNALRRVNRLVFEKSIESSELRGMGTTLVASVVVDNQVTVINVGDSRAYRISGSTITQITKDHSVVEELIDLGDITREEAKRHPSRNLITRAVGTAPIVESDIFRLAVQDGDAILLCSDGLSNVVSDEEMLAVVHTEPSGEACCRKMVDLVLTRGAPDNVTVALFRK